MSEFGQLHERAIEDRDKHPWHYYKFSNERLMKMLDQKCVLIDEAKSLMEEGEQVAEIWDFKNLRQAYRWWLSKVDAAGT